MSIASRLLLCIALAIGTQTVSGLELSPEIPVADRVLGPAPADLAKIASDGRGFLVVWHNWITNEVMAVLVAESGQLLDPSGIRISELGTPRNVVWTGTHYAVLIEVSNSLQLVTVTRAGVVSAPRTIVAGAERSIVNPFIASRPDRLLVVWSVRDGNGIGETSFTFLSSSGDPMDQPRTLDSRHNVGYYGAAATESGFLVLGRGPEVNHLLHGQVFLQHLSLDGRLGGRRALPEIEDVDVRSVGRVPEGYLVAWKTGFFRAAGELRMTLVSEDLSFASSFPLGVGAEIAPRLVMAEGSPFIFFHSDSGVWARRIDVASRTSPASLELDSSSRVLFDAAWNGARFLVALQPRSRADGGIYARAVDTNLRGAPEFEVARAPFRQSNPDLATASGVSLVAWEELLMEGQRNALFVSRVDSRGRHLDGRGVRIGSAAKNGYSPRVVSNGYEFLVVYEEDRFLLAARVLLDGRVLDETPIVLTGGFEHDHWDVIWTGAHYLVVWATGIRDPYRTETTLGGIRVADGRTLDSVPFAIPLPGAQLSPDLSTNGEHVLLSYMDVTDRYVNRTYTAHTYRATSVLLSLDGHVLGTPLDLGEATEGRPSTSWGSNQFVMAWTTPLNEGTIVVTRLDSSGNQLSRPMERARRRAVSRFPPNVSAIDSSSHSPDIAFDGSSFVVVWARYGADGPLFRRYADVYAARLSTEGEIGPLEAVAASRKDERDPVIAPVAGGFVIVYAAREDVLMRLAD